MNKLMVQHSMALELVGAILRYGINEMYEKQSDEAGASLNKDITDWLGKVSLQISPFLKSDIDLLFKNFEACGLALIKIILENDLDSPMNFLQYFKGMSGDDFIKKCFEHYKLDEDYTDISFDSEDELIIEALEHKENKKEAEMFILFKRHPEEMKKRLDSVIETFNDNFFKEVEGRVKEIMSNKVNEHNKKFNQNPKEFLELVSFGDYSYHLNDKGSLKIYISYFLEYTVYLLKFTDYIAIIYGQGIEDRYDSEIVKRNSEKLFKALSDEKRLEILRLIGKRKWYSNELAKYFGLTSATMSYHINKLIEIGIVTFESGEQNKLFYKIDEKNLRELFDIALKDILGE